MIRIAHILFWIVVGICSAESALWAETTLVFTANTAGEYAPCPT